MKMVLSRVSGGKLGHNNYLLFRLLLLVTARVSRQQGTRRQPLYCNKTARVYGSENAAES